MKGRFGSGSIDRWMEKGRSRDDGGEKGWRKEGRGEEREEDWGKPKGGTLGEKREGNVQRR